MNSLCLTGMLWAGCISAQTFPAGRGRAVFERVCGSCHPADVVVSMGNSREGWKDLVNEMFLRGGSATTREKMEIADYLARNYPLPAARKTEKTK